MSANTFLNKKGTGETEKHVTQVQENVQIFTFARTLATEHYHYQTIDVETHSIEKLCIFGNGFSVVLGEPLQYLREKWSFTLTE